MQIYTNFTNYTQPHEFYTVDMIHDFTVETRFIASEGKYRGTTQKKQENFKYTAIYIL